MLSGKHSTDGNLQRKALVLYPAVSPVSLTSGQGRMCTYAEITPFLWGGKSGLDSLTDHSMSSFKGPEAHPVPHSGRSTFTGLYSSQKHFITISFFLNYTFPLNYTSISQAVFRRSPGVTQAAREEEKRPLVKHTGKRRTPLTCRPAHLGLRSLAVQEHLQLGPTHLSPHLCF